MASTTAPAAIPDPPNHPPAATDDTGGTGPAATPRPSLFAAVDPARPDGDDSGFLLPPSADGDTLLAQSPDGPSSDAFHDKPADPNNSTSSSTEGKETRVVRAWLLAGAERWRKGADARNKALDIRKAQAQALQIKRAETVNRSEKIVGGNTSTDSKTDSGKSSSSKTSGGSSGQGGTGRSGSGGSGGGRSGGSSRGPAGGGSGGGAGRGQSGTQRKDTKNANGGSGSGGKGWKDNAAHKSAGGGKDVKNRSAGSGGGKGSHVEHKTARETPPARAPKTDKTPAAPKPAKTDTTTKTTKADKAAPPASSSGADKSASSRTPKAGKETDTCGKASGIDLTKRKEAKDTDGKTTPPTSPTPAGSDKNPGAKGGTKTPPTLKKDPKDSKTLPHTPKPGPGAGKPGTGRPSINTQPTREAGYRDGTRIGKAEAHVRAYKDGLLDGRSDIKQAADREKGRLDKAREQRKQPPTTNRPAPAVPPQPAIPPKPTTPPATPDPRTILMKPKETPVATETTPPSGPVPIPVKNTNASHLELGTGADRQFISRGEVRNLAGHQHNLTGRKDTLLKIAERAKVYEAHAQEQTKKITNYLEQARSSKVKGGEKVIAELAKLEEASRLQEAKAREVVKRAERSADACTAVSANLNVRYADIYRAAADSPDGPAEFNYYRDLGYAHA
jgi:hypothetical protein